MKDQLLNEQISMTEIYSSQWEVVMKTVLRLIIKIAAVALLIIPASGVVMAATNQATDPGGGGVSLASSGTVTVTSSALALVKAVYSASTGSCLASSDLDALCGSTGSVNVPAGTRLRFVIYVDNTTTNPATDVRFQDSIKDIGPDYFVFQPNAFAAGDGIRSATLATGSNKNAIKTALSSGTNRTNVVSNADIAGIDMVASPDLLSAGLPGNAQLDIAATTIFAIEFEVIKQ